MITVRIVASASRLISAATRSTLRFGCVRGEQVAGDEDEVDPFGEGEIDGLPEGGELALALGRGLLTEVGVARSEVDVGRVEESQQAG